MAQKNLREPVVSGQFYPQGSKELKALISSFIDNPSEKEDYLGVIMPHAGYIYSGKVATQVAARTKIKDTVILLGPNHTGNGAAFSIMPEGAWLTPLGEVQIDSNLAKLFLNNSKYLRDDFSAHQDEHSLEVQLPILQYFKSNFKIVPITIKTFDLEMLKGLATELARVITENNLKNSVLFVASSDMTHYEPKNVAEKKDASAIAAITALDEDKLAKVVEEQDISMCGFAPVAVLIKCAKLLGAKKAKLVKYQTSGDVTADNSSVVGYAGLTIN